MPVVPQMPVDGTVEGSAPHEIPSENRLALVTANSCKWDSRDPLRSLPATNGKVEDFCSDSYRGVELSSIRHG